jgi:hypothetical protein
LIPRYHPEEEEENNPEVNDKNEWHYPRKIVEKSTDEVTLGMMGKRRRKSSSFGSISFCTRRIYTKETIDE